jgi:curved DNA-binding protein
MASRDFYDILGLTRKSNADEIKSAYRKLARQLHPDVNKAPDAQKKFTEVQNAYDVLSDEKKRATYDQFGPAAFESGAAQEAATRASTGRGPHYTWNNVGGTPNAGPDGSGMGFDPDDLGSIFDSMFGGGARSTDFGGGGPRRKSSKRRTHDQEPPAEPVELQIDFLLAAKGGMKSVRFGEGRKARTLEVRIPSGIENGTNLRMRAVGAAGEDVVFDVKVLPHKHFRRGELDEAGKGLDLFVDVPISIAESTLGGTVQVPTLEGFVELAVPAGSPSGRRLRLRGLGINDPAGRKGDLYAILKIVPPPAATLSDLEATALRDIAARGGPYRTW